MRSLDSREATRTIAVGPKRLKRREAEEKSWASQYSPRPRRAAANGLATRRLAPIVLTRTPNNARRPVSNTDPSMEALLPEADTEFVRVRIRNTRPK
jgi:hypothetical protein